METLNELKIMYENISFEEMAKDDGGAMSQFMNLHDRCVASGSSGAKHLAEKYRNKYLAYLKESERLEVLFSYEKELYAEGLTLICGVDEVGRGPLAGPVMACACILPKDFKIQGVDDSKKLSEKKRNEIYLIIKENALDIGIGTISPKVIDEINILQATFRAMISAVNGLNRVKPEIILVDGQSVVPPSGINYSVRQKSIISGDSRSFSIAAASIYAKVTRDTMMYEYHNAYPEYDFASNKGYGTQKHLEALKKYGPCPIHRHSFLTNI